MKESISVDQTGGVDSVFELSRVLADEASKISPNKSHIDMEALVSIGDTNSGRKFQFHVGLIMFCPKGILVAAKKKGGTYAYKKFPKHMKTDAEKWGLLESTPYVLERLGINSKAKKSKWWIGPVGGFLIFAAVFLLFFL